MRTQQNRGLLNVIVQQRQYEREHLELFQEMYTALTNNRLMQIRQGSHASIWADSSYSDYSGSKLRTTCRMIDFTNNKTLYSSVEQAYRAAHERSGRPLVLKVIHGKLPGQSGPRFGWSYRSARSAEAARSRILNHYSDCVRIGLPHYPILATGIAEIDAGHFAVITCDVRSMSDDRIVVTSRGLDPNHTVSLIEEDVHIVTRGNKALFESGEAADLYSIGYETSLENSYTGRCLDHAPGWKGGYVDSGGGPFGKRVRKQRFYEVRGMVSWLLASAIDACIVRGDGAVDWADTLLSEREARYENSLAEFPELSRFVRSGWAYSFWRGSQVDRQRLLGSSLQQILNTSFTEIRLIIVLLQAQYGTSAPEPFNNVMRYVDTHRAMSLDERCKGISSLMLPFCSKEA